MEINESYLIELSSKLYTDLNNYVKSEVLYNNTKGRKLIEEKAKNLLREYSAEGSFSIRCDETNNPPSIIDNGLAIVDVTLNLPIQSKWIPLGPFKLSINGKD